MNLTLRTGTASRLCGWCFLPLMFVVAVLASCASEPAPTPDEILGIWVTDAPRHQDRTFEIRDDAVIFGTGKFSAPRLYLLVGFEPRPEITGWQVCTLLYREYDGSIAELDLQYQMRPKPRLRFSNRKEFWIRAENHGGDDA